MRISLKATLLLMAVASALIASVRYYYVARLPYSTIELNRGRKLSVSYSWRTIGSNGKRQFYVIDAGTSGSGTTNAIPLAVLSHSRMQPARLKSIVLKGDAGVVFYVPRTHISIRNATLSSIEWPSWLCEQFMVAFVTLNTPNIDVANMTNAACAGHHFSSEEKADLLQSVQSVEIFANSFGEGDALSIVELPSIKTVSLERVDDLCDGEGLPILVKRCRQLERIYVQKDSLEGVPDGILAECQSSNVAIFYYNPENEETHRADGKRTVQ